MSRTLLVLFKTWGSVALQPRVDEASITTTLSDPDNIFFPPAKTFFLPVLQVKSNIFLTPVLKS